MHGGSAMSTTVTGSPPRGQVTSSRRAFSLPRASTTPGKLWLVRASLVVLCLEAGIIVLALMMAAGCGWGLTRRLAEYR